MLLGGTVSWQTSAADPRLSTTRERLGNYQLQAKSPSPSGTTLTRSEHKISTEAYAWSLKATMSDAYDTVLPWDLAGLSWGSTAASTPVGSLFLQKHRARVNSRVEVEQYALFTLPVVESQRPAVAASHSFRLRVMAEQVFHSTRIACGTCGSARATPLLRR